MKKIFAMLACLMASSAIYGLPVSNPEHPNLLNDGFFHLNAPCGDYGWGLEFGYRGDFVFNHEVKNRNPFHNLLAYERTIPVYRSTTNAAQLTLNLWEQIDIYGWMGASQSEFETEVNYLRSLAPFQTGFLKVYGSSTEDFAYGYGARVLFWQCGPLAIGVEAQYARTKSPLAILTFDGDPVESVFYFPNGFPLTSSNFTLKRREYQVSLGVSYRITWFIPYIAITYSNIRTKLNGPNLVTDVPNPPPIGNLLNPQLAFRNINYFGFAIGVTLVDSGQMELTAEARFIDQNALGLSADFRF